MPKAMIVTVGTGETVRHGICCSIRQQNPDHIVFLLTKESEEKTFPHILNDKVMQNKDYEELILSDENDVEEVKCECQKIIDSLIKKDFDPRDITTDFTSGTKAMSAGVVLAAVEMKLGALVYVSGKRGKDGRVISGAEKVISIEPNRTYAESMLKEAVNFFNTFQFDACLAVLRQARELIYEVAILNKISLLEELALAYSKWDKFELVSAFLILDKVYKNPLLADWGIKNRIARNKEVLYKEKDNTFCVERIADLLENAKRRGDVEKKYDDSVARLYRLIEYASQFFVNRKGLYKMDKKGNPDPEDLNLQMLPAGLQEKYLKYKNQKDGKVKLSLYLDYEVLFDLGDKAGKLFKQRYEDGELKKMLSLRNNSILAHGFNPVIEKTYQQMLSEVDKLIKDTIPEVEEIMEKVKFPQIKT